MTVLSRGARVRRGGRRPGWVLLTALLVLAMGASSALVFTNRVELLKLAVILALWAAVAGAFVSVLYRRQSDADQSRVRDLKLVYDLQLDREISARREYELTVESQLRRELASELRAQAADDLAELRAELSALRTSLEILFDTDLAQRPALETPEAEAAPERAYSEWDRNGETPRDAPYDWVASDRVSSVPQDNPAGRADETAIIDVPEEPLLPPRQPQSPPQPRRDRVPYQYEPPQEPPPPAPPQPSYSAAPPEPEPRFEPRQQPPAPQPEPQVQGWQPVGASGLWLPPGAPGSNWAGADESAPPGEETSGRRRRARHSEPDQAWAAPRDEPPPPFGEPGRRARSRHSAEYRDYGAPGFAPPSEPAFASGPIPAAATPPPPAPPHSPSPHTDGEPPPPPRLAPPPPPEHAPRHGGADPLAQAPDGPGEGPPTGGQSVAELLARLQVQPSEGGRRRRRDG
ncbi:MULTISPECIES: DUF6779 domain-containing protein [unclassified Mycobacterium]|uniref:DUF6779 domain-containing protein n=1 Tax=unclassified Mycobacterium TaxID=2642494 RepID=UPI0007FD67F8|nr:MULTISPECIES: DUF6779 domain-containing protein [unclassified Mycobacterium]OBG54631.1 hypothetical protein A5703_08960 [Mycobacterium sp. E188]OBG71721.1 hypothetical protein A5701_26725 [Mycobacterium sp. E3305]OBH37405.1 hypothetical protein A5691_26040 [Mycobacterium sp. E183]